MITCRKVSEADREIIQKWIDADPDHRDRCVPEFWMLNQQETDKPHIQSFVVEDAIGPIFYVRAESVMRLHIQFAPPTERSRLVRAIDQFTEYIKRAAKKRQYAQLIFDSVSKPLIAFLERRGFRSSPNEIVHDLHAQDRSEQPLA